MNVREYSAILQVISFPHHKHDINGVHPSEPADLKSVLNIIMEGLEE